MYPNEALPGEFVPLLEYCQKCKKVRTFYKIKKRPSYVCGKCKWQLFYQAGTIFEKSTTHMMKWYVAFYNLNQDKNTTAKDIERAIGVTYKTAHRMKKLLLNNWEEAENFLNMYCHPEHFKDEVLQDVALTNYYNLTKFKFKRGQRHRLMNFKYIKLTPAGKKVIGKNNQLKHKVIIPLNITVKRIPIVR